MKVIKDGQLIDWFAWIIATVAVSLILISFNISTSWLRWCIFWFGMILGAFSQYHSQAVALGLRPFEKFTWRAAKQTYWPKVVKAQDQQTCDDFIANLCLVEQFKVVKEDLINRWGCGIAPAMLFGGFGKVLVSDWGSISESDHSYICDLIEKAITNGGEQLKSMVSLGLLNAVARTVIANTNHQQEILASLGEQSRACVERLIHRVLHDR